MYSNTLQVCQSQILYFEFLSTLNLPIAIVLLTMSLFINQLVLGDYFTVHIFDLILHILHINQHSE